MQKIPKIIHYVWVGGNPKPPLVLKCIESWKRVLPDYEIKEWNENNFDINSHPYVKEAYENKKYAFVSDYIRLYVLKEFGGIYLDTDVEVFKPFDKFLNHSAFLGFENEDTIGSCVIGAQKDYSLINDLLNFYNNKKFIENNKMDLVPNVVFFTEIIKNKYNIKTNNTYQIGKENLHIYPEKIFSANPMIYGQYPPKESYSRHHANFSWEPKYKKHLRYFKIILKVPILLIIKPKTTIRKILYRSNYHNFFKKKNKNTIY